ncbi:acetylornithine aminotransferase [Andreesenia angusta]|uniref:Acetylornithine aminotransferase n=1 Tax=Andreesenia angusta TaxID=39480 RepID=A0A1S1V7Y5_9FIRM|nr:acetylornithine transaminase [Andreesenia angusta]OHW62535.1 acetylornithine aminotransferase [Andreesenia angusta]
MKEIIESGKNVIMNTYASFPIVLDRGEGCYVYDTDGKEYLDFVAGIAVNTLGYNNKKLEENIVAQFRKLHHCSNLYWTEPTIALAEKLTQNSAFDKVFFCNSGTEAIEAGLKLSRKYGNMKHGEERYEIITMENSFHGRTFGSVTATGQTKYQKGFGPLLPGVSHVKYNSIEDLKRAVTDKTCAIVVEAIQGEGGVCPAEQEFLENIRDICDEKDIVLVFDEVQTGIGRTGKLFAYEMYGVEPDIICMAKGLAGGIPMGAMMAKDRIASAFEPGNHASTFGGNPLACSAALTVLDELLENGLMENVKVLGERLKKGLEALKEKYSVVEDVRGMGLMQGIAVKPELVKGIVASAIENGLLLVGAGANVIRFVPPLVVGEAEIDKALEIMEKAIAENSK